MIHAFDPGPVAEPYASLARDYPGADVYPANAFRVEWGPIFHRGRLDDSARVLVIGQDPAASEDVARRILVGEAGHRLQGLLAKLGIDLSYVLVNTFLYSVYGQKSGEKHRHDPEIIKYRQRWLDALTTTNALEAVISLGGLADEAWTAYRKQGSAAVKALAYAHVTHPTAPESASKDDPVKLAATTKALMDNWNTALNLLHPAIAHPDTARPLVLYGDTWADGDKAEIPEADLPAGAPAWMRSSDPWAQRTGDSAKAKRRTVTVTIPAT